MVPFCRIELEPFQLLSKIAAHLNGFFIVKMLNRAVAASKTALLDRIEGQQVAAARLYRSDWASTQDARIGFLAQHFKLILGHLRLGCAALEVGSKCCLAR